jgi:5'-3' exonuclease
MGIQALWKTLRKLAPQAFEPNALSFIQGADVFVDTPVFAYAAMYTTGNDEGVAKHVLGLAQKIMRSGASSCTLVFDGKPHVLKHEELCRRREVFRIAQEREQSKTALPVESEGFCTPSTSTPTEMRVEHNEFHSVRVVDIDEHVDISAHPLWQKTCLRPTQETFLNIQRAACEEHILGCIVAPEDAEKECARLASISGGIVCTSDGDALTYGAPRVLRYIPGQSDFQMVTLHKVLEALDLSLDAFQQWCVLCGSDFCSSIKGVGPVTSLKLVKAAAQLGACTSQGELIARILTNNPKLVLTESGSAFAERYGAALAIFQEHSQLKASVS